MDQDSEDYRLLHPLVSKQQKIREKKIAKQQAIMEQFEQLQQEVCMVIIASIYRQSLLTPNAIAH